MPDLTDNVLSPASGAFNTKKRSPSPASEMFQLKLTKKVEPDGIERLEKSTTRVLAPLKVNPDQFPVFKSLARTAFGKVVEIAEL
jgi:hypothetical protein